MSNYSEIIRRERNLLFERKSCADYVFAHSSMNEEMDYIIHNDIKCRMGQEVEEIDETRKNLREIILVLAAAIRSTRNIASWQKYFLKTKFFLFPLQLLAS